MTQKFDDFRAALKALCMEHGVRLTGGRNHDDYTTYMERASEDNPAGLDIDLEETLPPTPEDLADRKAREHALEAQAEQRRVEILAQIHARFGAAAASDDYESLRTAVEAYGAEQRKNQMRVSTDPSDPAYIDARPRRVWLNDREIIGWVVADEFRRCVITPDGVLNGAVLIERLPADPSEPVAEAAPEPNNNLCGMFVAVPKVAPPVVAGIPEDAEIQSVRVDGVKVFEAAPSFAVPAVPVKPAAMSAKKRKKGR